MARTPDPRVFVIEEAEQQVIAALRPLCQGLPATTLELVIRTAGVELTRADREALVRRYVGLVEQLGELLGVLEGELRIVSSPSQPKFEQAEKSPQRRQ